MGWFCRFDSGLSKEGIVRRVVLYNQPHFLRPTAFLMSDHKFYPKRESSEFGTDSLQICFETLYLGTPPRSRARVGMPEFVVLDTAM